MNSTPHIPDPRPLYARATAQLATVIATVRPERLDDPTPCEEYDVRALLGHVVSGARRIATVPEGGDGKGADVPEWTADVPAGQWPELYEDGRKRMLTAWESDEAMDAVVTVPWGRMPGRIALAGSVMETVGHTWDLARAIGWSGELDEEVARFALATAHQALPAEGREHLPFGETRQAPQSADTCTRLAAWLGRDPEWQVPGAARQ
ncbi:TIGR03086 family metal-binding protein [Streptomyces spirodelae]|uniref:TIGR03086 family protein n=1 Tax=Streptomyces spirodelae TaxID=2812904 RepID=A0ABS3WW89_9ACTN|nr:TIGR03086 family metal-binding protein [Streptomyces spirodelae]MBO8187329.1 TIGR03086 family protein [Streptomyces spirodelae]